jgi:hypothetical protein
MLIRNDWHLASVLTFMLLTVADIKKQCVTVLVYFSSQLLFCILNIDLWNGDSGQGQVAGCCKCSNEPSNSIKCGEFLDWLRNF